MDETSLYQGYQGLPYKYHHLWLIPLAAIAGPPNMMIHHSTSHDLPIFKTEISLIRDLPYLKNPAASRC
jgi:hypothetical protein